MPLRQVANVELQPRLQAAGSWKADYQMRDPSAARRGRCEGTKLVQLHRAIQLSMEPVLTVYCCFSP